MRTIPLIPGPTSPEHTLGHNGTTWAVYEHLPAPNNAGPFADAASPSGLVKVRDLNSYEARFVSSVQDFMAEKAVKDLQQIRRDLTAAREATARVHSEWRTALGANTGDDLAEITREIRRELQVMHRRAGDVADRARYTALSVHAGWSADSHGYARGLAMAATIVTGLETPLAPAPPVWGHELGTLRGQYKLHRSEGYSVLGSAVRAFFCAPA